MNINPPSNIRKLLYIITMAGSPIMAYLQISGYIGVNEMALWLAEVTVVAGMAGFNVPAKP